MKLVTFRDGHSSRLGALLQDDRIADLAEAERRRTGETPPALLSMQALIEAGAEGLELVRELHRDPYDAVLTADGVELLSPLPVPVQMRDFVGFETHYKNAARMSAYLRAHDIGDFATADAIREATDISLPPVYYKQPLYYKCNRFAVAGSGTVVRFPAACTRPDYELEIGAVIGKRGHDIAASQARDHIFGYLIFNDFTARDLQAVEMDGKMGPAKGKDFDGANILGPCIVTADEIGDPYDLTMRAWVNGELWSDGNSQSMTWSFEQMIEHASRDETLHPAEIIGSGTVGLGCGLESLRFLEDGDEVVLEIERIGRLRNKIAAPSAVGRN
jgi:2-keto-4-pentenoate hydratase/2-oxohepta-3-ene-1,7-dioic acid hydratase in catechol pathway